MAKDTSLGVLVMLDKIRIIPELQARCRVDEDLVKRYAAIFKQEDGEMDPVHLFVNAEEEYLLADGQHRYFAASAAERKKILAIIHDDDRANALKAALDFGIEINGGHGKEYSPEDKRRAVALELKADRRQSDRKIARLCRVSPALVKKIRDKGFTANEPRKKKEPKAKPEPQQTKPQDIEPVSHTAEAPAPQTHTEIITDRQKTLKEWVTREDIGVPEIREVLETATTTIMVVPKNPVHIVLVFKGSSVKVPITGFRVKSGVIEVAADQKAFLDALDWELSGGK